MKKKYIVLYSTLNEAYIQGQKMERIVQVLIVILFILYWIL
ncbi:hypothetical protein pEaSNUABM19_00032 [Erwinia phage pEa_SNUABM_19]|nr:hypothetical protein pEaSNUABM19_00032 [Erwinia phage pEa_SNUABM_19]QXO11726.1 hypothetical protein pEaSNUABM44_00030 [Erwinia phage pEa_SNUABM_44]QXO12277.1 hypothetical protein pEaSNUABM49_00031 [Erwinia phage pEa_SNUABM_49]